MFQEVTKLTEIERARLDLAFMIGAGTPEAIYLCRIKCRILEDRPAHGLFAGRAEMYHG